MKLLEDYKLPEVITPKQVIKTTLSEKTNRKEESKLASDTSSQFSLPDDISVNIPNNELTGVTTGFSS